MCARVYTISEAIKMESRTPVDGVIPLGNTHLGRWDDKKSEVRQRVRAENRWNDCFVVLNVARFHAAEQRYKGIDLYVKTLRILRAAARSKPVVFILCGKGDEDDFSKLRRSGIEVRAGVSDCALEELYAAADAYANFSQWEGYNLGIGQALAMGLPVVASDIPAHRAFGVTTVASPNSAAQALMGLMSTPRTERTPRLWTWEEPINILAAEIESVCPSSHGETRDRAR
jgi:glycosyltransferase involved in cell wall biosynthesis